MSDFLKHIARPVAWIQRRSASKPECALAACPGLPPLWRRLLRPHTGICFHGQFYCQPECLQTALLGQMSRLHSMAPSARPGNRIPLGLLMVARGKLTHLEVRAALEAQRRARYGRIGDWIEKLGFASEHDVTAALALQWGCPVASSFTGSIAESPGNIPLRLLEAFQMIPFNFSVITNTLYLAFGTRVDHAALYAIERVLDCRTQPSVAPAKTVARQLDRMRQQASPGDVEFWTRDLAEMGRIASSYIARLAPDDVRLSRVGQFIWLRLKARTAVTSLLFCLQQSSSQSSKPSFFPASRQRPFNYSAPALGLENEDSPFLK
ncbi:MAG: hypothetical protein WBS24_02445 [Terriglobales bacterium]